MSNPLPPQGVVTVAGLVLAIALIFGASHNWTGINNYNSGSFEINGANGTHPTIFKNSNQTKSYSITIPPITQNDTMILVSTLPTAKVSIDGQSRSSFTGVTANYTAPVHAIIAGTNTGVNGTIGTVSVSSTAPAPKVTFNGLNRTGATGIANTTTSNTWTGYNSTFGGSHTKITNLEATKINSTSHIITLSLHTGTQANTNDTMTGTFAGTLGALLANTFSYLGHIQTIPSFSGTIADTNSTMIGTFAGTLGALLSNTFSYLGHIQTIPNFSGTIADTNSTMTGTLSGGTISGTTAGSPTTTGTWTMLGKEDFGTINMDIFPNNGIVERSTSVGHSAIISNTGANNDTHVLPSTSSQLAGSNVTNSWTATQTSSNNTQVIRGNGHGVSIASQAQTINASAIYPKLYLPNNYVAFQPQNNSTSNSTAQTFTISGSYQMQDSPIFIKPQITGTIVPVFTISVSDNTINGGCNVKLQYGTGAAPKTGAALTGTTIGLNTTFDSSTVNEQGQLVFNYPATGLTQGTSYWIEPAVTVTGAGGTCKIWNEVEYVPER